MGNTNLATAFETLGAKIQDLQNTIYLKDLYIKDLEQELEAAKKKN